MERMVWISVPMEWSCDHSMERFCNWEWRSKPYILSGVQAEKVALCIHSTCALDSVHMGSG